MASPVQAPISSNARFPSPVVSSLRPVGAVVDNVEHTETTPVGQLIGEKIDGPALIDRLWHHHGQPRPESASCAPLV
jgi:hypothetical protein